MDTMTRLGLVLVGSSRVIVPEVGIHPDVSEDTYHNEWSAASNSGLTLMRRSPAHMNAARLNPKTSAALVMGRAIHRAILEPQLFDDLYRRGIEGDGRSKAVREAREALEAEYGVGYVLAPSEFDAVGHIRDAVRRHVKAMGLIGGPGESELSIVWIDPETGVRCKARLDRHSPAVAGGAIIDIKSTRDASPYSFERTIFALGYHRQGAMYLDGAHAVGLHAEHYVILAVEKEPPFGVAAYRLTEAAIDAGRDQLRPMLARYGECAAADEWPGYPTDIMDISLPVYAWPQITEEVA